MNDHQHTLRFLACSVAMWAAGVSAFCPGRTAAASDAADPPRDEKGNGVRLEMYLRPKPVTVPNRDPYTIVVAVANGTDKAIPLAVLERKVFPRRLHKELNPATGHGDKLNPDSGWKLFLLFEWSLEAKAKYGFMISGRVNVTHVDVPAKGETLVKLRVPKEILVPGDIKLQAVLEHNGEWVAVSGIGTVRCVAQEKAPTP